MKLVLLGDQAVLAYLADEPAAVALAAAVRAANPPWLFDVVPAYATAGVFFDADQIGVLEVIAWLESLWRAGGVSPLLLPTKFIPTKFLPTKFLPAKFLPAKFLPTKFLPTKFLPTKFLPTKFLPTKFLPTKFLPTNEPQCDATGGLRPPLAWTIPVCYEMQLDMLRVCEATGLSANDVIRLHSATTYTVYAVGFVPGFPYLGYLSAELCGVGRLPSPRLRVEPGSVGMTGRQTGIYPLPRPGGWNIIGRTPLVIVDVADGFFPLRVGDTVRFERIDERHYRELEGERLEGERGA